jgi:hypothetical protein
MFGLSLFAAVYWMLLTVAWLPTIAVAAIGGVIAALVSWSLWPLGIVLVAGSLLGWLATLVWFMTLSFFYTPGRLDYSEYDLSDLVAWGVGPAVAIVVALAVMSIW